MEIRTLPLTQLQPAPYNPRVDLQPGNPVFEQLKRSLSEFGAVEPLVWNARTGHVVGGHQRLKVLQALGHVETEVVVVDLPLEKEKALNIALNKIQGAWDEAKLATLLDELTRIPDFEVGLTGFTQPELSELFDARRTLTPEENFDEESAAAAIETPITQPGDLIELGAHRLLCGDSANPEHLRRLLGDEPVQLLHTDPPYNVDYYGGNRPHASGRPKPSRQWARIYADNMTQEQYESWLRQVFANTVPHLTPGAPVYVWNGHRQFGPMHLMLSQLGVKVSCVITWAKPNFAIGFGDYNQATEFCLYGWKEGAGHSWHGPANESTLWQERRDPTHSYVHPTQKPLALAQRAMRNSSQRGDRVLDLFLGSGSTLIAAESLQRRCCGMEIDPRYCDVIVRRYIAYVGKEKVAEALKARYVAEAPHA